jgi:hypothetical protein
MITLTSEKLPSIGVGFPMKGSIHQGPELSMPTWVASPEDLAPPWESSLCLVPAYTVRRDKVAHARRLCILACRPQFVGWCR